MSSVCIGIHVHAEPDRLRGTLDSLRAHSNSAQLVLLPDGADRPTYAALQRIGLPQLPTSQPRGTAACFNRLAAYARADVIVLLESGCIVGPGWLQGILNALNADLSNGLAGPSTNRSWNEQNAFPDAVGGYAAIASTARVAQQRFGSKWQTLEPLYSLADFCYAVRREVIDKVGAADESYGPGPCWEMDYNIRAARAGFRGVWACSSYVYRSPLTAERKQAEERGFSASKKRYQDKFCALRLAGSQPQYEPHCRGDACEHFAPAALIQIHLPLPPAPAVQLGPAVSSDPGSTPLVSCVMATRDRPNFLQQAIEYFLRQDYPNRELIIVDDGPGDLSGQVEIDPRIRYVKVPRRLSIGAKRNRGCELARGSLIAQWDDDDWYSPDRLTVQIEPLLAGKADVSALQAGIFFDLRRWEFWQCSPAVHRRMFVEDVIGGTLVFKRRCWDVLAKYPDISLAEDATFLTHAMRRGAQLHRIQDNRSFMYVRHAGNSWSFECGKYLDPASWSKVPEPELCAEDRGFYAAQCPARVPANSNAVVSPGLSGQPLISCIMPTCDRRSLIPQAIGYFLRQDYPNRELIIVDDGSDAVGDLVPQDTRISYVRLPQRQSIGAKRNLACEYAKGSIIAHWDDDDWIADWRLSYQADALAKLRGNAACGLSNLFYFDPRNGRAWMYCYPERQRRWVAGNTLCYHKDLWRQRRFHQVNEGEDTRFVWSLPEASIVPLSDHKFYVATVHDRNSSPKRTQDRCWHVRSAEEIRSLIAADFSFYESWPLRNEPASSG
jgi:glycosyltransferase involved in cell wall biosynthesis/GT2 family glycosyltransferase